MGALDDHITWVASYLWFEGMKLKTSKAGKSRGKTLFKFHEKDEEEG